MQLSLNDYIVIGTRLFTINKMTTKLQSGNNFELLNEQAHKTLAFHMIKKVTAQLTAITTVGHQEEHLQQVKNEIILKALEFCKENKLFDNNIKIALGVNKVALTFKEGFNQLKLKWVKK